MLREINELRRLWIGLGFFDPTLPHLSMAFRYAFNLSKVGRPCVFRHQIQNVFVAVIADATLWEYVHVPVAGMRTVDFISENCLLSEQHIFKTSAV